MFSSLVNVGCRVQGTKGELESLRSELRRGESAQQQLIKSVGSLVWTGCCACGVNEAE